MVVSPKFIKQNEIKAQLKNEALKIMTEKEVATKK
jgi:hypothetical protein